jgi:hypothetical protein
VSAWTFLVTIVEITPAGASEDGPRGLEHDRREALLDHDNRAVTVRPAAKA